jgi:hypothetical protein
MVMPVKAMTQVEHRRRNNRDSSKRRSGEDSSKSGWERAGVDMWGR